MENVRGRILTMFGGSPRPRRATMPARESANGILSDALSIRFRSVWRIPLRREARLNVDAGIFVFLHRFVQLLQLRQLDLSAVVRVLEHAVVLQRPSRPVVPNQQAQDRAVDHQRVAVLQRGPTATWASADRSCIAHTSGFNGVQQLRQRHRRSGIPQPRALHTDDSIEVRYFNDPENEGISKMAFSFTGDRDANTAAASTCNGGPGGPNRSSLAGWSTTGTGSTRTC